MSAHRCGIRRLWSWFLNRCAVCSARWSRPTSFRDRASQPMRELLFRALRDRGVDVPTRVLHLRTVFFLSPPSLVCGNQQFSITLETSTFLSVSSAVFIALNTLNIRRHRVARTVFFFVFFKCDERSFLKGTFADQGARRRRHAWGSPRN